MRPEARYHLSPRRQDQRAHHAEHADCAALQRRREHALRLPHLWHRAPRSPSLASLDASTRSRINLNPSLPPRRIFPTYRCRVLSPLIILDSANAKPIVQTSFRSFPPAYPLLHINAYSSAVAKAIRPEDVNPVLLVTLPDEPTACCHLQHRSLTFLCPISGDLPQCDPVPRDGDLQAHLRKAVQVDKDGHGDNDIDKDSHGDNDIDEDGHGDNDVDVDGHGDNDINVDGHGDNNNDEDKPRGGNNNNNNRCGGGIDNDHGGGGGLGGGDKGGGNGDNVMY
ncbi:hypothetical protein EDB85DRAFT_1900748 [Lactarius pseudohatsudake]|nr:hypothetical protein EDB85DRAFT_1900748 [Lactarius pseudohatsudake]